MFRSNREIENVHFEADSDPVDQSGWYHSICLVVPIPNIYSLWGFGVVEKKVKKFLSIEIYP